MKRKILALCALAGILFIGTNAIAAENLPDNTKPVSKVSNINDMPEDTVVYVQGYIVQNLGDDNYLFRDDSGTIAVEIDEDLIEDNTLTPNTVVFIMANINKDGDVTSLEAEEIQFMPAAPTPVQTNK